jgi:hypothetical protein
MPKKRAPGGGRKSQGEFHQLTYPFSVRMPEDLRNQLESAARESGRSSGQELLMRLNRSFALDRNKDRDPATRAICFLVAELIEKISWPAPSEWRKSPFLFKAFRIALEKLLAGLQPAGKIKPPDLTAALNRFYRDRNVTGRNFAEARAEYERGTIKDWKTPESAANAVGYWTIIELFGGVETPDEARIWARDVYTDPVILQREITKYERSWYGMADVRRDLQLGRHKKEASRRGIGRQKS